MKLTDKQEKSTKYLSAVLALRDRKDELVQQKAETVSKIATIKTDLESIEPQLIEATDVHVSKALRTKKRELQELLEDNLAVNLDILKTLKTLNNKLQPLRMAARDELDTFTDICQRETEAIQEKAREDVLDIRDAIDMHPFQMADRITVNIIENGGWQNKDGGHMDEPVKHKSTKDGPDRMLNNDGRLGEFQKPEENPWIKIGRMSEKPGK